MDAVITSMCMQDPPDPRMQQLFVEILARPIPGGWFLDVDPVTTEDSQVAGTWQRAEERLDPSAAAVRHPHTPEEQQPPEDDVRHMSPLSGQLGFLRDAGFEGIDVSWENLDQVIYDGRRPYSLFAGRSPRPDESTLR